MRIEATINDKRGEQLESMQTELKMSRSALIEEAVSFYIDAVWEVRKGRKIAAIEQDQKVVEFHVPSFGLLRSDWTKEPERIAVSPTAHAALKGAIARDAAPSDRLTRRRKQAASKR